MGLQLTERLRGWRLETRDALTASEERAAAVESRLAALEEKAKPTESIGIPAELYYPLLQHPSWGLQIVDDLVRQKGLAVYREMEDWDDMVSACLAFLVFSRLASGWTIKPASEQPEDQRVCDFTKLVMEPLMLRYLMNGLEAVHMCFSCQELIWDEPMVGGEWAHLQGYRDIRPLAQETVTIKRDEHGEILPDGIWQSHARQFVVPGLDPSWFNHLPREKFALWSWRRRWGNELGRSVLRSAYPFYFFKRAMFRTWADYMAKAGRPIFKGKVPEGSSDDVKRAAVEVLRRFQSDQAMVHEANMDIEIIFPPATASLNFKDSINEANKGIAHSCFQPGSFLDQQQTGSYAAKQVDQGTVGQILEVIGLTAACELVEHEAFRPLVTHNFGPQVAVPKFAFLPLEQEDLESMARIDLILSKMGFPLSKGEIAATYKRKPAETPEDELQAPPSGGGFPGLGDTGGADDGGAQFAQDPEGRALDMLISEIRRARTSHDPHAEVADLLRGNGRTREAARTLGRQG